MYFHDKRLQRPVTVETPDPAFARQAMGLGPGVTGLLAGQGLHRPA